MLFVLLFIDKAGHFFGNSVAFVDGKRQRVLGFHIALECFGFTAVSYTHLDVYKRQLPFLAHGRISAYRFGLCRQTQHCAALLPRKYPRKEEKPQQAFC